MFENLGLVWSSSKICLNGAAMTSSEAGSTLSRTLRTLSSIDPRHYMNPWIPTWLKADGADALCFLSFLTLWSKTCLAASQLCFISWMLFRDCESGLKINFTNRSSNWPIKHAWLLIRSLRKVELRHVFTRENMVFCKYMLISLTILSLFSSERLRACSAEP